MGPWCSVDGVGCVFGLLLLPHAAEKSVYTFLKSLWIGGIKMGICTLCPSYLLKQWYVVAVVCLKVELQWLVKNTEALQPLKKQTLWSLAELPFEVILSRTSVPGGALLTTCMWSYTCGDGDHLKEDGKQREPRLMPPLTLEAFWPCRLWELSKNSSWVEMSGGKPGAGALQHSLLLCVLTKQLLYSANLVY